MGSTNARVTEYGTCISRHFIFQKASKVTWKRAFVTTNEQTGVLCMRHFTYWGPGAGFQY